MLVKLLYMNCESETINLGNTEAWQTHDQTLSSYPPPPHCSLYFIVRSLFIYLPYFAKRILLLTFESATYFVVRKIRPLLYQRHVDTFFFYHHLFFFNYYFFNYGQLWSRFWVNVYSFNDRNEKKKLLSDY